MCRLQRNIAARFIGIGAHAGARLQRSHLESLALVDAGQNAQCQRRRAQRRVRFDRYHTANARVTVPQPPSPAFGCFDVVVDWLMQDHEVPAAGRADRLKFELLMLVLGFFTQENYFCIPTPYQVRETQAHAFTGEAQSGGLHPCRDF